MDTAHDKMRMTSDRHRVPLGVQSVGRASRMIKATNLPGCQRGAELHTEEKAPTETF